MKVDIHKTEQVYKGFFTLHRAELSFEKFDGTMSRPVSRLAIERRDAVAVLTYDSRRKKILLVKQFRFPMYMIHPESSWMLEVVAGTIEANQPPEETALREIEEEIGYGLAKESLHFLTLCCPSPGGLTERIYLYLADVQAGQRKHGGGGLIEEAEDIQVVEMDYEETFNAMAAGRICDAKTLICLLWFQKKLQAGALG